MKIVHYIGSFHFGGIEKLVFDLSKEQQNNGHEIVICVGKMKGEFLQRFQNHNFRIIDSKLVSGFDLNPIKCLKIRKIFREQDVVHLHAFHLSVALSLLFIRKKIIYTEHGNFAFGRKKKIQDRINHYLRRLFFKLYPVEICCNSDFTKNYVEQYFYKGKRLHTIKNGISLESNINSTLAEKLKSQFENKFIIGTSSRLAGFKRIDRLIHVFKKYELINANAILLIIGDGPEMSRLKHLSTSLSLQEKIYFLAYQEEISTFQSIFDVSIFPSEKEPFGLVAVECFNLNKPVLVFNDGGGLVEIVAIQNKLDICANQEEMIERIDYYSRNKFVLNPTILSNFNVHNMYLAYQKIYCQS